MTNTSLTVSIDQTVYQKARDRAQNEGKTLDQVIAQILGDWVQSWTPAVPKVPVAPPSAAYRQYAVKRGDTLAQIAVRFYGDAKRYIDIAQANNITNPGMIRVGQTLRIPELSTLPATPTPPPATPTPPAVPVAEPARPAPKEAEPTLNIEFIQSQHYNNRPAGSKVWAIVVHSTANSTLEGVIKWFQNPQSFVSAHYNIGKDGRTVQMVQDELRAWHAGKSVWKGVNDMNNFSIGIELVNKNDGRDPYPDVQYQVLVALCKQLTAKYGVRAQDIVGHKEISLSGKTDPAGFDMEKLRRDVAG